MLAVCIVEAGTGAAVLIVTLELSVYESSKSHLNFINCFLGATLLLFDCNSNSFFLFIAGEEIAPT